MFRNFGIGVGSFGKAMSFIAKHNLWIYFVYPVLISILLIIGGTVLIVKLSGNLQEYILGLLGTGTDDTEGWRSIFSGALSFVLNIGLKIIFFFLLLWLQKYIVLIIMSPVLAALSERVDEIYTGRKYSFDLTVFIGDVFRGIGIAVRNMLIEFGIIFLFFLISWIPIIGWASAIVLYIVSCYFYGFSMLDYTSERRRLSMKESVSFIRANKGLAIGNGLIYSLISMVPYLGVIVAPVLSVVAATLGTYEVLEKQKQPGNR
jgi:CysZ protein